MTCWVMFLCEEPMRPTRIWMCSVLRNLLASSWEASEKVAENMKMFWSADWLEWPAAKMAPMLSDQSSWTSSSASSRTTNLRLSVETLERGSILQTTQGQDTVLAQEVLQTSRSRNQDVATLLQLLALQH